MSTMSQSRSWQGWPMFSFGFRPFFLGGSFYAGLIVALWVPWYLGQITVPTTLAPLTWHVHELLFGYILAIIAGFLLTAVPNWTGRLPVVGYPLIGLFALWGLGRVAIAFSWALDPLSLGLLSLAFPLALIFAMGRELIAGGNTKNLIVVMIVAALALAQMLTQYEHWVDASISIGPRLGIASVITLIMIIGGRVIPSFTRNWIRKVNPGREPQPVGRFDLVTLLIGVMCLLLWTLTPTLPEFAYPLLGWLLLGAGFLHLVRQCRWTPHRALSEPIVLIMHLGYLFVPIGFILSGLSLVGSLDVPELAGQHAWSVGAVGCMTLAIMTRATLGHTGRDISASTGTVVIYACVVAAAVVRIAAALVPGSSTLLLAISAILWCVAFFGFTAIYGPMLCSTKLERQSK